MFVGRALAGFMLNWKGGVDENVQKRIECL